MYCAADQCSQGREDCNRAECGYARREDEPLATPQEAMSWPARLLIGAIAVGSTAALSAFVYFCWPLFVAAVN
jgi:hypothetical protein